jgi:hypothetical protein
MFLRHSDPARYGPLVNQLLECTILFNFANPQDHVPAAERNNRVIKEWVRATYHRLPYTHLPKLMVQALVHASTIKLNYFPAKGGVSPYYSPRLILYQTNLHYNKHCLYAFGSYVQAHNEPIHTNTNAPRSLDCIYLTHNSNHQGGHILLHLPTNKTIVRRAVTVLPITPHVISQVHAIAICDGQPSGLKISNKLGHILFNAAWIAGVDYDDDDEDDAFTQSTEHSTDEDTEATPTSNDELEDDDFQPDSHSNMMTLTHRSIYHQNPEQKK